MLEALFKMGFVDFAIDRMKRRYDHMVNHPDYTTLFEGWGIGEMGYELFQIIPHPGSVKQASATIQLRQ